MQKPACSPCHILYWHETHHIKRRLGEQHVALVAGEAISARTPACNMHTSLDFMLLRGLLFARQHACFISCYTQVVSELHMMQSTKSVAQDLAHGLTPAPPPHSRVSRPSTQHSTDVLSDCITIEHQTAFTSANRASQP